MNGIDEENKMAAQSHDEADDKVSDIYPSAESTFRTHANTGDADKSVNNHNIASERTNVTIVDDTSRLKVESARGRLESSTSNLRHHRPPNTASSNHHVSFTGTRSKTSYQLPIVYFVVNKDRMPRLAENFTDDDQKTSLGVHASKSRHQFLTRMREKKRLRDEKIERVKNLGTKVGLKVEPVKTHGIPLMSQSWISKQPNTPFNTISERSELRSSDTVFFNHDELLMGEKSRETTFTTDSDGYNMSLGCPEKPRFTPFDIELPGLKTSENRSDTPGSASSKKVHFSKNNTRSKSCNIQLPKVDQSAEEFLANEQKRSAKSTEPRKKKTVLPVTTTPSSKPKRDANPLSLPKIDLLTPIYDELILKTFQAFMTKKNPLADKHTRAILQRVSAFLHPLDDTPKSTDRRTPNSRPRTREASFFSTEPPEESLELDYTDLSSTSFTIDGKSMSMLMRDVESKHRKAQVPATCFQMAPPGLDKEGTEHFQSVLSDKKPDIYIPTSC